MEKEVYLNSNGISEHLKRGDILEDCYGNIAFINTYGMVVKKHRESGETFVNARLKVENNWRVNNLFREWQENELN